MDRTHIQAVSLLLSIVGLVVWTIWMVRNRRRWLSAIDLVSWLLHVILFYSCRLSDCTPLIFDSYYQWSAVLRLHAVALMLGRAFVELVTTECQR